MMRANLRSELLPDKLACLIDTNAADQIPIGHSRSKVFKVCSQTGEPLYLKTSESADVAQELEREVEVLNWLRSKQISVPQTIFFQRQGCQTFFLMSAMPGVSLAVAADTLGPAECMRIGASLLRQLHTTDISNCPFDRRLEVTLRLAKQHLEAGTVDEEDFDADHSDKSGRALFEEIESDIPEEDLVLTHGDYCFPNILVNEGKVSGIIDLGRCGVADRYQDIALFLRSFKSHAAEPDPNQFIYWYGLVSGLDLNKATFFRKLDEFF